MRTDQRKFKLRDGVASRVAIYPEFVSPMKGQSGVLSQSGGERNRLFVNDGDGQFDEVSGIAGVDAAADGRSFAILDLDRDGWLDMVVTNANTPRTVLYRNQIGGWPDASARESMIAVRFVGANHAPHAAAHATCRDGYGAVVTVSLDGTTLMREHRCGEGLAAQNSATMVIGMGRRAVADAVSVRWPSGIVHRTVGVAAGTLLTVYEDPSQASTGEAFVSEPYAVPVSSAVENEGPERPADGVVLQLASVDLGDSSPRLVMYTTMATWCAACRGELPTLGHLRSAFSPDELRMFGVPVDEKESLDKLQNYASTHRPAYELLSSLSAEEVAMVKDHVKDTLLIESLPVTVVTRGDGRVLLTRVGVPSVSELRRFLRE